MKRKIALICLFSILTTTLGGCGFINLKDKNNTEDIKDVIQITSTLDEESKISENEINDYLKEDSDLENISKQEKYEMGLLLEENSDTDKDGLTDKEEIEIYHTDPLKSSTIGDLYTDYYKVHNDMDVNQYYEMGEFEFLNNECTEVRIIPEDANDLYTYLTDVTGYHSSKDNNILKEYRISNFNGTLEIDKLSNSDIMVFSSDDSIAKEIEIDTWGGKFKLDFLNAKEEIYYIVLFDKGNLLNIFNNQSFFNTSLYGTSNSNETETVDKTETTTENEYIIFISPILNLIDSDLFVVFSTGNEKNSSSDISYVKNVVTSIFGDSLDVSNDPQIVYVPKIELDLIYKVFQTITPWMELGKQLESEEMIASSLFLTFFKPGNSIDDTLNIYFDNEGASVEEEKYKPSSEKFDLYYDTFPFTNYGSYISPGGNCAGMALITAQLFNGSELELTGSINTEIPSGQINLTWDVTKFENASTFYDRGLVDYEISNENFHKDVSELTEEELQLVNYIGAMWVRANQFERNEYKMLGGNYKYSMIENLMDYLDSNKIALLHHTSVDAAHTINVYDYYYDPNNEDVVYLKLYDNNFPFNQTTINGELVKTNIVMKVERVRNIFGDDTFEFHYKPFEEYGDCYEFTSKFKPSFDLDNGEYNLLTIPDLYILTFTDEKGTIIGE